MIDQIRSDPDGSATVYLNGEFVNRSEAGISPDDRGFLFADGVYEVVRFYGGNPFAVDRHLARLERGLSELSITGFDIEDVGPILTELIGRNSLNGEDCVGYIQVTRGSTRRQHSFPEPPVPPTVYLSVWSFQPKANPRIGVPVITHPDLRWARCDIKSIQLLPNCLANQRAHEQDAFEAILVRDGVALEGSHSSLLTVSDGVVCTAPNSNYVLPGITRELVLDLCRSADIPYQYRSILEHELREADEVMLAGTTTEVLPVISVDGNRVGNGEPGPITRRLIDLYSELISGSGTLTSRIS